MFRRAVLKSLPLRSGGHAHPDFPFLGYYQHKRPFSPYDSNLWVYDGMNPEYIVDFQAPQFTFGHIVSRNFLLAYVLPLVFCFVAGTIVHSQFKRPFIQTVANSDKDPVRNFFRKVKNDNVIGNFKHPLGHMHTYADEGWEQNFSEFYTNKFKL
jgi:hypothetical protein